MRIDSGIVLLSSYTNTLFYEHKKTVELIMCTQYATCCYTNQKGVNPFFFGRNLGNKKKKKIKDTKRKKTKTRLSPLGIVIKSAVCGSKTQKQECQTKVIGLVEEKGLATVSTLWIGGNEVTHYTCNLN